MDKIQTFVDQYLSLNLTALSVLDGMGVADENDKKDFLKSFLEGKLPTKQFPEKRRLDWDILPVGEYNVLPAEKKIKPLKEFSIETKRLLFKDILVSMGDITPKNVAMHGIYHDADNKCLVGTDCYKLIVIPEPSILNTDLLSPIGGHITVKADKYPNYRNVFPDMDGANNVVINAQDFYNQVAGLYRTKYFLNKSVRVRMVVEDTEFYMIPENVIDIIEIFLKMKVNEVTVSLINPVRPIIFTGGGIKALVMPELWQDGNKCLYKTLINQTTEIIDE